MALLDLLTRWLSKPRPTSPGRLSRDEAVAIAQRAAASDPECETLTLARLEWRSGNAIWIVSSATVGSMLEISIDDATGTVLEKKRVGIR